MNMGRQPILWLFSATFSAPTDGAEPVAGRYFPLETEAGPGRGGLDDFALLGCSPNASKEEINAAWRALARTNHPDGAKDPVAAGERMKAINAARQRIMAGTPRVDRTARKNAQPGQRPTPSGAKSRAARTEDAMRMAREATQAFADARARERALVRAARAEAARERDMRPRRAAAIARPGRPEADDVAVASWMTASWRTGKVHDDRKSAAGVAHAAYIRAQGAARRRPGLDIKV